MQIRSSPSYERFASIHQNGASSNISRRGSSIQRSFKPFSAVLTLNSFQKKKKKALVLRVCMQYKSVETTVGKGEIARNEQFLLFPQCFQLVWKNILPS